MINRRERGSRRRGNRGYGNVLIVEIFAAQTWRPKWIPRIHVNLSMVSCIYNSSVSTVKWEISDRESEAHRPTILAYAVVNN